MDWAEVHKSMNFSPSYIQKPLFQNLGLETSLRYEDYCRTSTYSGSFGSDVTPLCESLELHERFSQFARGHLQGHRRGSHLQGHILTQKGEVFSSAPSSALSAYYSGRHLVLLVSFSKYFIQFWRCQPEQA
jgi:hypothetical protein